MPRRISSALVTGSDGFLGGVIARKLSSECERLILCGNRENDRGQLNPNEIHEKVRFPAAGFAAIVRAHQPQWLIHCAGSSSVAASIANPLADQVANVAATESIYRALADHSPKTRLIFLSSAAVYGQPTRMPITESTSIAPISPYGEHKRACELLGAAYQSEVGLDITNLRIFSAYGPGLKKQVLWDIYRKALADPIVSLFGTGRETRDFIYAEDIAAVVLNIMRDRDQQPRGASPQNLNLASGRSIKISELAELFLSELGLKRKITFTGDRLAGAPQRWNARVDLSAYGLRKPTTLEAGLAAYARWLKNEGGDNNADRILAAAG